MRYVQETLRMVSIARAYQLVLGLALRGYPYLSTIWVNAVLRVANFQQ